MSELIQAGPLDRVVPHRRKALPRRSLVVRFLEKVDIQPGGCWLWTATLAGPDGYGWFRHPDTHYAHRVSYLLFVGPLAKDQVVDHLCCNPGCVNPDHLEATTALVNTHRAKDGVAWTACDRNHPTTPTRLSRRRTGHRCLECHRLHNRKSYERQARTSD